MGGFMKVGPAANRSIGPSAPVTRELRTLHPRAEFGVAGDHILNHAARAGEGMDYGEGLGPGDDAAMAEAAADAK